MILSFLTYPNQNQLVVYGYKLCLWSILRPILCDTLREVCWQISLQGTLYASCDCKIKRSKYQVTSYIVIGADSLVFPLTLAHIPNHIKDQTTCLSCPLLSWFQEDDICYVIDLDALSNLGWWHLLCRWFRLPVWSWTTDWVLTVKPVMFEFWYHYHSLHS